MSPRSVAHLKNVAQSHSVCPWDVLGRRIAKPVSRARDDLMYRMYRDGMTYRQIGQNLARQTDTVMRGVWRHLGKIA